MCWRVLDIPASIGSTRCAGSRPAPFFPCVRSALSVLFVIGGSLAPGVGDLVLVDAILTPTREPSLLSSQVQQGPGHPRIQGWTTVDGQWVVEDMAGAPVGKKVLMQKATKNAFNVIVAPSGPYSDVDISVKFDPLSGKEDASGGIVFRFNDGKYYVVRANGLENNFRLYYYDRGRRQLASASVKAPPLGQWHLMRVVAVGDHIQAWLDGTSYLDHHDSRFKSGRVGLWTKADSITAFSDLTVRGVVGGG